MTDTYCFLIREKDWDSDSFQTEAGQADPGTQELMAEHGAFAQAVEELGLRITGGSALANARYGGVVTPGAGDRKVDDAVYSDSPYADSSELITGFYLVEVPDLDVLVELLTALPPYDIQLTPVADPY